MKSVYLLLLIPFLQSCENPPMAQTGAYDESMMMKVSDTTASNPLNPYDSAGEIHDEILAAYMSAPVLPSTLQGILASVDSIAQLNSRFIGAKSTGFSALTTQQASGILNDSDAVATAIANAGISSTARARLEDFADGYFLYCATSDDFGGLYDYIVDFEDTILASSALSTTDKRSVLTVTSIVRHSQFRRRRPKKNRDLDWEVNMFHLAGAIEGSPTCSASAVSRALSLGIAENR